jgi:hypothetical protein
VVYFVGALGRLIGYDGWRRTHSAYHLAFFGINLIFYSAAFGENVSCLWDNGMLLLRDLLRWL